MLVGKDFGLTLGIPKIDKVMAVEREALRPLEHLGNRSFWTAPESHHKTQSVPSLHAVCTPLWVRVLDSIEEKSEEARFIP